MTTVTPTARYVAVLMIGLASASGAGAGQVPVTREARHRVAFENPEFRILSVDVPPGDTTSDHSHDYDIATVAMTDRAAARIEITGQPWGPVRPRRPLGDAAISEYTGNPGRHVIQNVGDIPYQLFAVENLKQGNWSSGTPLTAPGTTLTTESRAFRIYDVRLQSDLTQIHHVHSPTTIAVLISGRAMSAGAESPAAGPAAPVGLKQLVQAGEWALIPAGESHHLVRLGAADARVVEIEVR
jgi:quercetin dioxygenase-like cupin family protein